MCLGICILFIRTTCNNNNYVQWNLGINIVIIVKLDKILVYRYFKGIGACTVPSRHITVIDPIMYFCSTESIQYDERLRLSYCSAQL